MRPMAEHAGVYLLVNVVMFWMDALKRIVGGRRRSVPVLVRSRRTSNEGGRGQCFCLLLLLHKVACFASLSPGPYFLLVKGRLIDMLLTLPYSASLMSHPTYTASQPQARPPVTSCSLPHPEYEPCPPYAVSHPRTSKLLSAPQMP